MWQTVTVDMGRDSDINPQLMQEVAMDNSTFLLEQENNARRMQQASASSVVLLRAHCLLEKKEIDMDTREVFCLIGCPMMMTLTEVGEDVVTVLMTWVEEEAALVATCLIMSCKRKRGHCMVK
jgi:hypothetical protein